MKVVFALAVLIALMASKAVTINNEVDTDINIAYGYLSKTGSQLAKLIREAESQCTDTEKNRTAEDPSCRIVDGFVADLGDIPYQAGLVIDLQRGQSACGGSLLNARRVLTAAHCWSDGLQVGVKLTVVLGSVKLYSGGTRIETSKVTVHSKWNAKRVANDIALIYLPHDVQFSNIISPIALPERNQNFAGHTAVASGFGQTGDRNSMSPGSSLNYVELKVITNAQCRRIFGFILTSNVCTIGVNKKNICKGDSGGPLAVTINNTRILVGVSSFVSRKSCENGLPGGFARVSSFIDWINKLL